MAHSLSSKKRIRQNVKRRALNKTRATTLKGKSRKVQVALQKGNVAEAEAAVSGAVGVVDRAAAHGTLHRNAAARRKSRMAKKLNALKKQPKTA